MTTPLRRFNDLAGIQAQILSETRRQDLHARPPTSGGCRPAPQTPEPPAEGQCRDAAVSDRFSSMGFPAEQIGNGRIGNPLQGGSFGHGGDVPDRGGQVRI
jgi:hypothetical protein